MALAYITPMTIGPGAFSDEYAVSITNSNGNITSGFFSAENILDKRLEVKVLQTQGDIALVEIPGTLLNGPDSAGAGRYISVRKNTLIFHHSKTRS